MKNFDYEKKYHYGIKYIIIGFPILLLLLTAIFNEDYNFVLLHEFSGCMTTFYNLPINNWYKTLIELILNGVGDNLYYNILISIPLYIFWVYVLDLVLDIFVLVPKLAHKLMKKLGG